MVVLLNILNINHYQNSMKKYFLSCCFICTLGMYFSQIPDIKNQFEWSLGVGINQNVFEPMNSPFQQFKNNFNTQITAEAFYVRQIYKEIYFQLGAQFGGQIFTIKPVFEYELLGREIEMDMTSRAFSPIFSPKLGVKKIFPELDLALGFGLGARLTLLDIFLGESYTVGAMNIDDEMVYHFLWIDYPERLALPFGFFSIEYQLKMKSQNRLLLKFNTDMNFRPSRTGTYSTSYSNFEQGKFYSSQFVFSLGIGFIIATKGSRNKVTEN